MSGEEEEGDLGQLEVTASSTSESQGHPQVSAAPASTPMTAPSTSGHQGLHHPEGMAASMESSFQSALERIQRQMEERYSILE
ncbi:hypothetical protein ACOMHN_010991 [Nucella lapillus]